MQRLASASDDSLLHELHAIARSHRRMTAELVLHLGEVDARRLHVEKGFPSLFAYCVEELHFSEDEACRRIEAARLARRFPAIHPLLETGMVSLTVLGLLKPHLTADNHPALLAGVSGSSVRKAKEWLAARFPVPDVPTTIRKQASPRSPAARVAGLPAEDPRPAGSRAPAAAARVAGLPAEGACLAGSRAPATAARVVGDHSVWPPPSPAPARGRLEPLSEDRFLVKFTASRAMRDKLEQARDWMRHANPSGELAVVLERAVDLLISELEKTQQGRANRPRKKPRAAEDSHVTRAARRDVVARDGWRCSFVAEGGRRCDATTLLELDHETPRGCGGGSRARNLRVRCRAHNRLEAERVYGRGYVHRR